MSSDAEANPHGDDGRYSELCERAVAFVDGRGGAVHEDVLIGHVFGNTGSLTIWRPLLRSVLAGEARLTFRADGHWCLTGRGAGDPVPTLLDAFVAVDVETTGLRPLHQRIIEVALYRYQYGQLVERFESLVNPGVEIPAFISNLTTITNTHVEDAPSFAEIASQVSDFIGDGLIVGHNVSFDLSFLNAELKRADIAPLVNERLDTMSMAVRLLRQVRKPSLDRVATAVGLTPRKIHRAGRDAELTAEVALRLADEAARQGLKSLDELKRTGAPIERHRPRDDVGRGRAVLDRAWLASVPKRPGVYVMRDRHNAVIYVGKAKNLRDRVASYYSQPLGYTRKMDGLLESMTRIDTEVVGSELQALLLESQLIRRHQPRYNTAMRSSEHYPYIKVDIANPWPRVLLAKVRKDDGARYFGPYRSASGARRTIDVINTAVPLRTCTRSFKSPKSYGAPCLRLDLGKCLGPCVAQAIHDEYRRITRDVVDFLDGDDEGLRARLWQQLEAAAERRDYERASRLRKDLRSALAVIGEQTRMRASVIEHNLVLVEPSREPHALDLSFVLEGRIWARFTVSRDPAPDVPILVDDEMVQGAKRSPPDDATLIGRMAASLGRYGSAPRRPVDHDNVDEQNILTRWLYRHAGHPSILPLDVEHLTDPDQLRRLIDMARGLEEHDLIVSDHRPVPDSSGDRDDEVDDDGGPPIDQAALERIDPVESRVT